MSRTWVNVAAAEWSDCGGGRGNAGIRSSDLGKNMTKTPNPTTETETDLEGEYHHAPHLCVVAKGGTMRGAM